MSNADNSESVCVIGSTTCGVGACQESSICVNDVASCTPGTPTVEICDSADNDCDGSTDEELGSTTCGVGACIRTVQNCLDGQTQTCVPGTPTIEICGNGIDEDCNGADLGCNATYPDSCSDTDGGWIYNLKGTVSGYKNNAVYSNTDYCLTNASVIEYYCSGTDSRSINHYCVTNTNTTNITNYCLNGACIY